MAFPVGRGGRQRSSTGASRGLSSSEQTSEIAELIAKFGVRTDLSDGEVLLRLSSVATQITDLLHSDQSAQDTFRRGQGFEASLKVLAELKDILHQSPELTSQCLSLTTETLRLLRESLHSHGGNQKYFDGYVDGWRRLSEALASVQTALLQMSDQEGAVEHVSGLYESLFSLALKEAVRRDWYGLSKDGDDKLREYDGEESADLSSLTFEHPQAASAAVHLALSLGRTGPEIAGIPELAAKQLRCINAVVEASIRNRVGLWQTDLVSVLLPEVLGDVLEPATKSAARDLTLNLMGFGLGSLDDVALLFKQACNSDDARNLLLTALRRSKQPSFVQFDLAESGYSSIELPSLPRAFPPTSGYTLTMWIRIDEYDPACHTTLFGAFDATQACFVMVYLEKDSHQLILQTSVRSSRPSVRFKSTRVASGRWYHLALVHRKSTAEPSHSSALLFVDGEFAEQVKCGYPESPPALNDKQISGSPGPGSSKRTQAVQAFFGTPHDLAFRTGRNEVRSKWSLASAHLYSTPLTDEFVAVHHRLGPRYTGNLQDCLGPLLTYRASAELNRYNELLHPDRSEKSDIVNATEGRGSDVVPEVRLLLSISPSAIIAAEAFAKGSHGNAFEFDRRAASRLQQLGHKTRALAVNAAVADINEAVGRSFGTGVLTGDPVVVVTKPLDDASWCLAGCLPLLIHLLEAARTKSAFLQAVEIYVECVKDNWRISEAMEKGNGFGLLALIIRQKLGFESGFSSSAAAQRSSPMLSLEDRQSLPLELLRLILGFVGYNIKKPEDSMIVNPMGYRVLLIDFDTWRRCDTETQKLYYSQFEHFVLHNRHQGFNFKRLSRMRVVRKLIEAVKSEEILSDAATCLMNTLRALLVSHPANAQYRDLAMFVVYALQDDRLVSARPVRSMASVVNLRQRTASWAKNVRGSRPSTPGGAQAHNSQVGLSRSELAVRVLEMLTSIVCEEDSTASIRRFNKAVPNRWLLHLLAETDSRVVELTTWLICRSLTVLGDDFKAAFVDKNGGFVTLKSRLKAFWRMQSSWQLCFAILFGQGAPKQLGPSGFTLYSLVEAFRVGDDLVVVHPEIMPTLMAMLEAGLRAVVKDEQPAESETSLLKTIVQFSSELYARSASFREFAWESRFVQELLFVLYPVLVGSDRLSADTELQAEKDTLTFRGEEVKLRPHSNSLGERPPSVRSLNLDEDKRTPSPNVNKRAEGPRRLSSFVMVNPNTSHPTSGRAQFNPALAPKKGESVKINVGNDIVESVFEIGMNLFIDLVCNKDNFQGIGLFLKVPPGFREHQAYFESYVLVNTISQLWNHLKLNQKLFTETRVLKNLARYSQHMAEALFEGWFIDGAQPVLDFTGQVLEYLQQPTIAANNNVRLCSHHTSAIRVVFLRVTLWRLAELDDATDAKSAVSFLDKMNYWQTILFSTENQETLFIRLICFLLYILLVSEVQEVRLAAARLWRTILMQKPTESATLLTLAVGSDQRHLATGFMKLVSLDDEEFISWIDENRSVLDAAFLSSLNKPWEDFVTDENKRNEDTARARLAKRRDRLRQWQLEETYADDFMHRYEISTSHWRSNVHAQERVKVQRAIQDHQENVSHLATVFSGIDKIAQQPCGLDPPSGDVKWQLDETEAVNRMRMRTLPDTSDHSEGYQPKAKASERHFNGKLTVNTQVSRLVSDNILGSPTSAISIDLDGTIGTETQVRARAESYSNGQLLEGGFEMIDDPKEDEEGIVEDKNRKVMTSLQRGDEVQQLYNVSRIVGLEACEGLLVIGKICLYLQDNFFQRSDGEIVSTSQAPDDERDPYVQLISGKDLGAERTKHSAGDQETRHWVWAEVLSVSKRRFLFRDVSVEVFFTDGRSYLLTCNSPKVRDDLYSAISTKAPHVRSTTGVASEDAWRLDTLRNPEEAPQSLGTRFATVFNSTPTYAATKKWVKGEMSNFQYLMLINTLAGRTFNDLTQYPVFPWVLADYESEELDLTDPKTFRNFSKPMGCQTTAREADYRERYKQFAEMGDTGSPPFHYGTHYSSAMIVSSYLIRLQPFVQSYLLLQGGNFDHADRLFDSIGRAWLSASKDTMSDVRELTPEFFYLPEFLVNLNHYDFGTKQGGGGSVNDVVLPPWARGDPHIFIAKHREALESPHVSEHLHEWIDLVFGYKQRGESAVEATNVFQHLSYHGAKDLDTIHDPVERLATIGIIHSFGQTPHQVFQRPHPTREHSKGAVARLDTLAESLVRLPDPLYESDERVAGLTFSPTQARLLCDGPRRLNLLPNCDRFLQWGFADHSLRFFSSNTKRLLGLYENAHVGPVSTALFADSKTLVTAGADCTIASWTVSASRDHIDMQSKTYLFGHRHHITHLAASRVFSTLLSASADGQVLLWGLNRLNCIRTLLPAGGPRLQAASISNLTGHIVICQGPYLLLYTLNGHQLVRQRVCSSDTEEMTCCKFYEGAGNEWLERELVFTGHRNGVANVWTLEPLAVGGWHLRLVKQLNHSDSSRGDGGNSSASITAILPMPQVVYTGDENGRVWEWDCIQRQASISVRGR